MSADEEMIAMYPVLCDGCSTHLGWSDDKLIRHVLLCTRCMDHPEEVAGRLGMTP